MSCWCCADGWGHRGPANEDRMGSVCRMVGEAGQDPTSSVKELEATSVDGEDT